MKQLLALIRLFFHVTLHTEYAGTGRVRAFQFFRGAGYCIRIIRGRGWDGRPLTSWHWPNVALRGFTIYVRTAPTKYRSTWGRGFRRVAVTMNGNAYNIFGGAL